VHFGVCARAEDCDAFIRLMGAFLFMFCSCLFCYSDSKWSRWATSAECERDFPNLRSVTAFQRVLVVQVIRGCIWFSACGHDG
jgi:hypothetical protein